MKLRHALFLGLFFLLGLCALAAQEDTAANEKATPAEDESVRKASENLEEAKKALRFGVDSTVIGVIRQGASAKDDRIKDEVYALMDSVNPDVVMAVLDFAKAHEDYAPLVPAIEKKLQVYEESPDKLVVRYLTFLQEGKIKPGDALGKTIMDIANLTGKERQIAAIRAIGGLEINGSTEFLRDLYERDEVGLDQQKAILEALGQKKSLDQLEFYKGIIEDSGVDKELRRAALVSVGLLADESIVPVLERAMVSADLFERGAAIGALEGFPLSSVSKLYMQALRDASWRHRVSVVQQIEKRRIGDFNEALLYMAEKDPERPVRQAAIRALASMDAAWGDFNAWLKDPKKSIDLKSTLSAELSRNHAGNIEDGLLAAMEQEWKNAGSKLLEAICKNLASSQNGPARLYEKMLEHPSDPIKILGIQGIRSSKLSGLKGRLELLATGNSGASVQAAAQEALKKL